MLSGPDPRSIQKGAYQVLPLLLVRDSSTQKSPVTELRIMSQPTTVPDLTKFNNYGLWRGSWIEYLHLPSRKWHQHGASRKSFLIPAKIVKLAVVVPSGYSDFVY